MSPTPGQTVGPFFHLGLTFDGGPDLVRPDAPGAVALHGTVLDGAGDPVPDALIEIWQAGADGAAPRAPGTLVRGQDPFGPFTGFGRAATTPSGRFAFTTLEPAPHRPGAAAFVAVTVMARGLLDRLHTRAYLPAADAEGEAALAADPLLAGLDERDRATLLAVREADGSLRFDVRLQAGPAGSGGPDGPEGPAETVFLLHRTAADREADPGSGKAD